MARTEQFPEPRVSVAELNDFFLIAFPRKNPQDGVRITHIERGMVRCALSPNPRTLRPGGIISGPTQMGTADAAMYAVLLAHIGIVPMAVTTSLTIHFLRACKPGELIAEARLLKLGRRIATGDVTLWTEGPDRPCATAMVAYALPEAT